MEIVNIDINNLYEASAFLTTSTKIKIVDEKICLNGCMGKIDNQIMGLVSYERIKAKALIRYFVVKSNIDKNILEEFIFKLLDNLKSKAISDNCLKMICIINYNTIKNILKKYGFKEVDKSKVYIDEKKISETNFSLSTILLLNLNEKEK